MTFFFAEIAIGALLGALMSCIVILWVKFFVAQLYSEDPKSSSNYSLRISAANITDWIIIVLMTITAGLLAFWRQLSPEFFNDIILVSALLGVALIDRITMLIEGRIISLAIIRSLDVLTTPLGPQNSRAEGILFSLIEFSRLLVTCC